MNESMPEPNDKGVMLVIDDEEEVTKSLKRIFRKKYSIQCHQRRRRPGYHG